MSSISNRFFITTLEDGTTLHGSLSTTKPLTQAWNGGACVPDWETDTNTRPTIYLIVLMGDTLISPTLLNNNTWVYNGTTLTFNSSTHLSTNIGLEGVFMETTKEVTMGDTYNMPALKIMKNLASDENVDMDMITFSANYQQTPEDAPIPFSASSQIRITKIEGNGFFGLINFASGVSDITEPNQVITMSPTLYKDSETVNDFGVKWKVNGIAQSAQPQTVNKNLTVTEGEIIDHATIECEFYITENQTNTLVFTAFAGIDDVQDPEYMYIQYDGSNGNAASLRTGQSVTFTIWVGRKEDEAVMKVNNQPVYGHIYVKLLDGDGAVVTDNLGNQIPNVIGSGDYADYRPLAMGSGTNAGKGSITIPYSVVRGRFYTNLSAIVLATTDDLAPQQNS